MINVIDKNTVKLCCSGKGCPTIKDLGDGTVEITDDFGKSVIIKTEEAEILSDGVKVLKGQQLILG